ncbi:mannose-1-phosphate guanylyltransferase/mannose-6-phosphate isomerase [soil metagenome]
MNPIPDSSVLSVAAVPIIPVVLCGGSGSRLWPLSREAYPKQFLCLNGEESLLQQTVRRMQGIDGLRPSMLICNESSRFLAAEQLREIGVDDAKIVLEPVRRNTAPAIAVAALHALAQNEDPLLLVVPSDHLIKDQSAFRDAVQLGRRCAEEGDLVTFGVNPTAPETGYGYIRGGAATRGQTFPVVAFVEKPDLHTAKRYIESGDYYWNSGMFLFRASRYVEELGRFQPEILAACTEALATATMDLDFIRLGREAYLSSPDNSIDYAVMEHTANASMVAMQAGWSDIGSWDSVWQEARKDEFNNATQGDVLLQDCENCLVHGTTRLVTAVGISNAIVIETADAVLIMGSDCAQDSKKMVARLALDNRPETREHRKVFRPWGTYEGIGAGKRFQVKRITVNPGARLSVQMHYHRAEHWVVVSGTAKVVTGEKEYLLTENQSTYIPLGTVHSLENPGKIPLEIIEIQSGAYLGEDDIVRLHDNYGRA